MKGELSTVFNFLANRAKSGDGKISQEDIESAISNMASVAKSKDGRNILYDINKIKEVGHGAVSSMTPKSQRDSHINPNFGNIITEYSENVKKNFSMKESVEETKELIAVHNLSEEKILKTLKLGGFPAPSIAIKKAEHGHSKFGDISVVFGKDTIDPQKKENNIYGGDAWTPMFPEVKFAIIPDNSSQELKSALDNVGITYKTYVAGDNQSRLEMLNSEPDVLFSTKETTDGKPVVVVNDNIISNAVTYKEIIATVKKSLQRFKEVPIYGQSIYFNGKTADEYTRSKTTNYLYKNDKRTYEDKMRVAGHPYDIVYAITDYVNEAPNHKRKDNIVDFARGNILLDIDGRKYQAEAVIGLLKDNRCILYDIVKMSAANFEYKNSGDHYADTADKNQHPTGNAVSAKGNISHISDDVNKNFSTKEDDNLRSWYYAVGRENIEYQKIITAMGDAGYSTIMSDVEVNPVDIDKYARKVLKERKSSYDVERLKGELSTVFNFLANRAKSGDGKISQKDIESAISNMAGVAKSKDGRNILYDINKIKEVGHGAVSSMTPKSQRDSHINPNFGNIITEHSENVKKFFDEGKC